VKKRAVRPRGEARRRAILDAAIELYAVRGFRGTGLAAIGERVGVSHAGVLYHFGSAQNLLHAVLEERDRRYATHFSRIFQEGGLNALRRLPEVARVNLESPGLAQLYTVLLTENLDADAPAHGYFLERRRHVHQTLCEMLASGQQRGELRRDVRVEEKADEIIAFMDGAQIQYLLDPERVDLLQLYESYVDGLLRELRFEVPSGVG